MRITRLAVLAAVLQALPAQAADGGQGPYVLFGLGLARLDLGDKKGSDQAAVEQFEATVAGGSGETDGTDSSSLFGVAVGYRFNRYLALEGGYRNFGEMHAGYTLRDGPVVTGQDTRYQASGPGVSALGLLPLSPSWRAYARVDAIALRTSVEESYNFGAGNRAVYPSDQSGLRVGYGLGVEIDVVSGFAFRLDARRMSAEFDTLAGAESRDLSSLNLSLLKTF